MTISFFEKVYCDDQTGLLRVSEDGLYFQPTENASSTDLFQSVTWSEMASLQLEEKVIQAGYGHFAVNDVKLYEFKVVLASWQGKANISFLLNDAEDWERLQKDLKEREEANFLLNQQQQEEESSVQDLECDQQQEMEEGSISMCQEEANYPYVMPSQLPVTVTEDPSYPSSESKGTVVTPPVTATTYYPVVCRQEIGTLVLTPGQVQFVSDRKGVAAKLFPYSSFSAPPFFAPIGYPKAAMRIYYHVTYGNNQQTDFIMQDHQVLCQLEKDITQRILPWKDAPRSKVYLPPPPKPVPLHNVEDPNEFPPSQNSFFKFRGRGKSRSPKRGGIPGEISETAFEDSEEPSNSSTSTCAVVPSKNKTPLLFGKAKSAKKAQEDQPRKIALIACLVCCLITLVGLVSSLVFGYFFAERRASPPSERTPFDIEDYLVPDTPTNQQQRGSITLPKIPQVSDMSNSMTPSPLPQIISTDLPQSQQQTQAPLPTSAAPTAPPTTPKPTPPKPTPLGQLKVPIRDVLMSVSPDGGQAIRSSNTPQQAAYLVLSSSGAVDLWADDLIIQKYALTVLYYSTEGRGWTDGAEDWKDLAKNDCQKVHVTCDRVTNKVISIDLPHNNMQGSLPPELSLLTELQQLVLPQNNLTGVLPTELGLLKALKTLDLEENPKLEGVIPKEVIDLNLETIKVDLPSPS